MKKQLLIGAMLMGAFFTANAQYTSFESGEGYTAGDINEQGDWFTTTIVDQEGNPLFMIENQVVSEDAASDGDWGLELNFEEEVGQAPTPIVGAFHPYTIEGTQMIAFDVYIDEQSQNTSDFAFQMTTDATGETDNTIMAYIQFRFNAEIATLMWDEDPETGEQALFFSAFEMEWEPQTWYRVGVEVDSATGIATYYINGEEMGTSELMADGAVSQVSFGLDNFGGFAYVDNISDDEAASVNDVLASKFTVYPNPANNVINLANAENILVNGVVITDLNGRTVKNVSYNGVTEAQINVSDLAAGMYMMTVSSDKGTMTKKIVKN